MRQIFAFVILIFISAFTSASATPIYLGMHLGETAASALIGYHLNERYSVEAHYYRSDSQITHAGVNVDTITAGTGIVGVAQFPMKLRDVLPYFLYVKAGYQHTTNDETYSIPSSVTLTLPYSGKFRNAENQVIVGGGADYEFSRSIRGRIGIDFVGSSKFINLGAIYQF
ncbi:MAG: hypothetical protein WA632_06370 [Gallionella sp.]